MPTVSNKPWSDFKESDYTPEQWKAACLIVRGDGSTKAQCSLPVREPDGTLNKNALSAAAGALAGARGGVQATPEEKAKATATLLRLYSTANMMAPPSLKHDDALRVSNFLKHAGRKGMKWGQHVYAVSNTKTPGTRTGLLPKSPKPRNANDRAGAEAAMHEVTAAHKVAMRSALASLNSGEANRILKTEKPGVDRLYKVTTALSKHLNSNDASFQHHVAFNRDGHLLLVSTPKEAKHVAMLPDGPSVTTVIELVYDNAGNFISAKPGEEEVQHSDGISFLMHYGRKGMKWGQHIFSRVSGGNGSGGSSGKGGNDNGPARSSAGATRGAKSSEDVHPSVDAERFIRTHQKEGVEMSDREIREAVQRANMVKQYDDIFNPGPNSELKSKVENLQLRQQYAVLHRQMNPTAMDRMSSVAKQLGKGYESYSKLNDATGGELNRAIAKSLGIKNAPKASSPSSGTGSGFRIHRNSTSPRGSDPVHNVTNVGQTRTTDFGDPFRKALPSGG